MTRRLYDLNTDWRFHDGDILTHNQDAVHSQFIRPEWVKAGNHGLAQTTFDDGDWQVVSLPHDFVNERNVYDTSTPSCTGSQTKGIGWYKRTFDVAAEDAGKRFFLQFEGVYRDSEVWVNGCLAGRHLGGYMAFEYEITEYLKYGSANAIAVKADASEYEGWWYEGGGIYRDVHLLISEQVRVLDRDLHMKMAAVDVENKTADIRIEGFIDVGDLAVVMGHKNSQTDKRDYQKVITLKDPSGQEVYRVAEDFTIDPEETYYIEAYEFDLSLNKVSLWDLDDCHLYEAKVAIVLEGQVIDSASTSFGIRTIAFSAERGFELNGQTVKLKGVCGHDDLAGVGVALTRPTIDYKIDQLMSMGCNAYRCSHNPPSPVFLELCDQKGMLVIDETRMPGMDEDNLEAYITMIKRDRHHPSVICWSMGNEEMGIHETELGVRIFTKMEKIGRQYDSSRPFLYAINADYDTIVAFDRDNGMVHNPVGLNYFVFHDDDVYDTMHKRWPDLCMLNTETTGICSSRAFMLPEDDTYLVTEQGARLTTWEMEAYKDKIMCYGCSHPKWGMSPEASWKVHADRPYSAGVFLWTGFDYRGEVFPFDYPATISSYGLIDLCGFPKDWYYYMRANWTNEDVLHLLPHWNLNIEEGTQVPVWAFTNLDQVELFINGKSQGKKTCEKYGHVEWDVTYQKGEIKAIGYRDGQPVLEDVKRTAGEPTSLVLVPQKTSLIADNVDAVIVQAHLEDADGNMVINTDDKMTFEFEGPCTFVGTGNGDNLGSEPDRQPERSLFAGRCIVIAKTTFEAGEITITAKYKSLSNSLKVASEQALEGSLLPVMARAGSKSLEKEQIRVKDKTIADADGGI